MVDVPDHQAVRVGLGVDGSALIPHNGIRIVRAASEDDRNE